MLSKEIRWGIQVILVVVTLSWWTDMCLQVGIMPRWSGAFHALAACGTGLAGWLAWCSAYTWLRRDWLIPMCIMVSAGMTWSLGWGSTGSAWLGCLAAGTGCWAWMVCWRGIQVVHDWAHWCMLPMAAWMLYSLCLPLLEILL